MIFSNWSTVANTLLIGILAYATLILFLRLSGKRTLSKWNAFDAVVTVALGSMLATATLSPSTTLVQGIIAFGLFILLQFIITWLSVRSRAVRELVKARPTLLYYRGQFIDSALRQQRVTRGEVLSAVRERGIGALADVHAVVLETSGDFSVIGRSGRGDYSALADVQGCDHEARESPLQRG